MKIYGYSLDGDELIELSEMSIQADVTEVRRLVRFLEHCASAIESEANRDDWEHEHIADYFGDYNGPDVIVVNPKSV